ncbi:MAG: hypothetical protein ABIN91_17280 [Mucilaginibacter sp.]|uniref:hypothetical protein n=1 Tax=Mucilaginibacter sp. TaxID=1882438 RepID=UPI0032664766
MRNITFILALLLSTTFAGVQAKSIDSLQKQLDTATTNHVKAQLYTDIADELIQFNGQKTREITYAQAGKAVEYVLKAIHFNSKLDDTLAIRNNFNCLSSAYFIQHQYTQAKWFALQSLYISRNRKDVAAMINSLMQLASIKVAIKDYKMAEKDFNEAIVLSKYKNDVQRQIDIEKCLATLYDNTDRSKLALATEKHCDFLAANIEKITLQQAEVNKVRMIAQAKIDAEQAKIKAAKIALWVKANKEVQAKLAVEQAKTRKADRKKYLAALKAEYKWPLALNQPKAEQVAKNEEAKTESIIASN